jgi:hypothetical protein
VVGSPSGWSLQPARQRCHDERCRSDQAVGGRARGSIRLQKLTRVLGPGRKPSAMEGVLARYGSSSLTRRRPDRARRPKAMGTRSVQAGAQAHPGIPDPLRAHVDVRGRVVSLSGTLDSRRAGGRFGAEEPSIEAPPGPRRTPCVNGRSPPPRPLLPGSRDGRGRNRSWSFAVKRSSDWSSLPACGSLDLP